MNDQLALDLPPMPPKAKFVFPSAYGGGVASESPPQIHAKMTELRKLVGAIAAVKSTEQYGPKFPVRGAKDLNQKLANALNALDMVAAVVSQEITHIQPNDIPKNENKSGNPVFRTLVHVKSTVRIIAPDTSFIDVVGSGHGGDVDDKSGGKASTYSWKDAILKGLTIPHEDMVDTDDDSSGGTEGPGPTKLAPKGRAKKAAATGERADSVNVQLDSSTPVSEGGLKYVLDQIKKAESKAELENIKSQIQSGVLDLGNGPERLQASKAYTKRMKELE